MNILTSLLYWTKPSSEGFWREITDVAIGSYKGKLAGDWEYRQVNQGYHSPDTSIDDLFFENFRQLHKWWEEGHNVFYVNVDMIATQPFEVFGKTDYLWMPWQTDPPSTKRFPVNFNCAVMYIPKETKPEVWDYGFDQYDEYFKADPVPWAADQDIFNLMFYKQGIEPHSVMDNRYHWLEGAPELNVVPKEEAYIWHYFTTRGADEAFERMKIDLNKLR